MTQYHSLNLRKNIRDWANHFRVECEHWNNRHLYVLPQDQVENQPHMLPDEYLTRYRRNNMPYVSEDYYLSNPRPEPDPSVEPHHSTGQPSYSHDSFFPDPPTSSQNAYFPDPPTYTQNTFFPDQTTYNQNTIFPDPSSYTPQPQPHSQTYSPSHFITPSQQTRNFFDQAGFQSPGTQQFNQDYSHYTNQPIQPQPTQPFGENIPWEQTNDFLNASWAAYAGNQGGESSTAVHGGETSTVGEDGSPMTTLYNFLGVPRDDEQQYGFGHRQGHPPPCGTGGHMHRHN
jgi:hypothetical protein